MNWKTRKVKKNNATLRKNDEINRKRLQQRKKVDLFKV